MESGAVESDGTPASVEHLVDAIGPVGLVNVTVCHVVEKDEVSVAVSPTATVRDVLTSVAAVLERPEILKKGRLVRKTKEGRAYASLDGAEKIGNRRRFTLMGVPNLMSAPTLPRKNAVLVPQALGVAERSASTGPETVVAPSPEEVLSPPSTPQHQQGTSPAERGAPPPGIVGAAPETTRVTTLDPSPRSVAAPRHILPGTLPAQRLTLSQALSLQTELGVAFSDVLFQRRLSAIEQTGKTKGELIIGRQSVVLEFQAPVLAKYGFEVNSHGINEMVKAMGDHNDNAEFLGNSAAINELLGIGPRLKRRGERFNSIGAMLPVGRPGAGEVLVVRTTKFKGERLSELPALKWSSYPRRNEGADPSLPFVFVDADVQYQAFEGFGGSITEATARLLSQLSSCSRERAIDACFHAEKGLAYCLARVRLSGSADASFSNEGGILSVLRQSAVAVTAAGSTGNEKGEERPLRLVASPASPSAWMAACLGMEAAHAEYLVDFAQKLDEQTAVVGAPLWALTIGSVVSPGTCGITNVEMAENVNTENDDGGASAEDERDFVRDFLGPALEGSGLFDKLRLLVCDKSRERILSWGRDVYSDQEAAKYVWGTAFKCGDPSHEAFPVGSGQRCFQNLESLHELRPNKHLIMTEACQEGMFDAGEWGIAERYAEHIIKDLNNWTEAWLDGSLIDQGEGLDRTVAGRICAAPLLADIDRDLVLFQPSYYYIAHFSRYIQAGARRVLCGSSRDALETIAFLNPNGVLVVVVLNRSDLKIGYWLEHAGRVAFAKAPSHSITTLLLSCSRGVSW